MDWATWLSRVFGPHSSAVAGAFGSLPTQPTFGAGDGPLSASEFSLRARGDDVSIARMAYTLDIERLVPGDVAAALSWLDRSLPLAPAYYVDRVARRCPDLDVVLGATRYPDDWLAKVYLLAGSRAPEAAWPELSGFCDAAGANPHWVLAMRERYGFPTMVAADLRIGEPIRTKMYFRRRDAERPGEEHIASVRGRDETEDETLHARATFDVRPHLPKALRDAFAALGHDVRLVPTHLSWLGDAVTLYYQVEP